MLVAFVLGVWLAVPIALVAHTLDYSGRGAGLLDSCNARWSNIWLARLLERFLGAGSPDGFSNSCGYLIAVLL